MRMSVDVIGEYGIMQALYGLSLSKGLSKSFPDFLEKTNSEGLLERMQGVAARLCSKDGGHNKFLESLTVYLDISSCRMWWVEADTYRVGMTKNSSSTVFTITRRLLTQNDFVEDIHESSLGVVNMYISQYQKENDLIAKHLLFRKVKIHLPEGFLQTRQICTNYKTLRNIVSQRKNHRVDEWQIFTNALQEQLMYPEFIGLESKHEQEKEQE
jgi:hypothetical protein